MAKRKVKTVDFIGGHSCFRRWSAIYLMSLVIDKSCVHPPEAIIETICHKFGIEEGSNDKVNSELAIILVKQNNYCNISEVAWKINIEGDVQVFYEACEYFYVDTDGIRFSVRFNETAMLKVNGRIIDHKIWDSVNMKSFFSEMNILFSIEEEVDDDWSEYYEKIWSRFEKGDKWSALEQCKHASYLIAGCVPVIHTPESMSVLYNGMKFIATKWFIYLWEMKEQKKPEEYMLSLKSFVSKNQNEWANSKENKVISNNIYTVEHEEMRKAFVSEPSSLYNSLLNRILALWIEN